MVTHNIIIFIYIVKLLSRILFLKLTCLINTLRNNTLNGIKFQVIKKRYSVITLDDLAIDIWADVFSYNLPVCDDPSHPRQLDCIYSALVGSLHVSTIPLNKMPEHCSIEIP